MTSKRKAAGWAAGLGVVAGCAAPGGHVLAESRASTSPGTADSTPLVVAKPDAALSPRRICEGAFGSYDLLDWAPGTVANFRAYQFGGPVAKVPLAHVFPNVPDNTRGAWCGTKDGAEATHWWAVVVGHDAASAITIRGPGEGVRHGSTAGSPQVP